MALQAIFFLLICIALNRYAGKNRVVKALVATSTARILLAIGAILLAIEGTWSVPIHKSIPFGIYALALLFSLSQTVFCGIQRKAKIGFTLNHLGIFLIIWASFFGASDVVRSKMMIGRGEATSVAYTADGMAVQLPFIVGLEDFRIDYYDDGTSPKQYTSTLLVGGERMETSVNHPCSCQGYTIYQDGYDRIAGQYTVLQLVRDPWLPFVYVGMALLAIGSVLLLFGKWKARITIPVTMVLTILFTLLTIAKINFGTLMPALRSWWFVPHLFIYMVAYSLMALALVMWLVERYNTHERWQGVSENLVRSSSALLIIGMLTGSVWAREAWGDYWAWDPKENWAAVTWFVTLMHLHLANRRGWQAITILILAFLALQITWNGVNYLPSAMDSLHTYNS